MSLKKIFKGKLIEYLPGVPNMSESPIIQILDTCHEFQLKNEVINVFDGIMLLK